MTAADQWRFAWDRGEAFVNPLGAMLAPVAFDIGEGQVAQPFAIAPWSDDRMPEHAALPPLLRQLRGEWVGVPFGTPTPLPGLPAAWQPLEGTKLNHGDDFHGYSSNADWQRVGIEEGQIELALDYPAAHVVRQVRRRIAGIKGKPRLEFELAVEVREPVELPIGIHPVFRLPSQPGRAELRFAGDPVAHTYPVEAEPGISNLVPGLSGQALDDLPLADGRRLDLRRLPLAFATEELVLVTGHGGGFSLTNHEEGYTVHMGWDAEAFPGCMLWVSNRGRTAYPWNARFLAIGIEPVAAPFDLGVAVARNPGNPLRRAGIATAVALEPRRNWTTNYWIEVSRAPA
jgi:hypothetical protein